MKKITKKAHHLSSRRVCFGKCAVFVREAVISGILAAGVLAPPCLLLAEETPARISDYFMEMEDSESVPQPEHAVPQNRQPAVSDFFQSASADRIPGDSSPAPAPAASQEDAVSRNIPLTREAPSPAVPSAQETPRATQEETPRTEAPAQETPQTRMYPGVGGYMIREYYAPGGILIRENVPSEEQRPAQKEQHEPVEVPQKKVSISPETITFGGITGNAPGNAVQNADRNDSEKVPQNPEKESPDMSLGEMQVISIREHDFSSQKTPPRQAEKMAFTITFSEGEPIIPAAEREKKTPTEIRKTVEVVENAAPEENVQRHVTMEDIPALLPVTLPAGANTPPPFTPAPPAEMKKHVSQTKTQTEAPGEVPASRPGNEISGMQFRVKAFSEPVSSERMEEIKPERIFRFQEKESLDKLFSHLQNGVFRCSTEKGAIRVGGTETFTGCENTLAEGGNGGHYAWQYLIHEMTGNALATVAGRGDTSRLCAASREIPGVRSTRGPAAAKRNWEIRLVSFDIPDILPPENLLTASAGQQGDAHQRSHTTESGAQTSPSEILELPKTLDFLRPDEAVLSLKEDTASGEAAVTQEKPALSSAEGETPNLLPTQVVAASTPDSEKMDPNNVKDVPQPTSPASPTFVTTADAPRNIISTEILPPGRSPEEVARQSQRLEQLETLIQNSATLTVEQMMEDISRRTAERIPKEMLEDVVHRATEMTVQHLVDRVIAESSPAVEAKIASREISRKVEARTEKRMASRMEQHLETRETLAILSPPPAEEAVMENGNLTGNENEKPREEEYVMLGGKRVRVLQARPEGLSPRYGTAVTLPVKTGNISPTPVDILKTAQPLSENQAVKNQAAEEDVADAFLSIHPPLNAPPASSTSPQKSAGDEAAGFVKISGKKKTAASDARPQEATASSKKERPAETQAVEMESPEAENPGYARINTQRKEKSQHPGNAGSVPVAVEEAEADAGYPREHTPAQKPPRVVEMQIALCDGMVLNLENPVSNILVENRQVCDTVAVSAKQIAVVGKATGGSRVQLIFADPEIRPVTVSVTVHNGAPQTVLRAQWGQAMENELRRRIPGCDISLIQLKDRFFLKGSVPQAVEMGLAVSMIQDAFVKFRTAYPGLEISRNATAADGGLTLINMLTTGR